MAMSKFMLLTIHGPNGNHACYVTAPARASLSQVKDGRGSAYSSLMWPGHWLRNSSLLWIMCMPKELSMETCT
ncbi:uncharacterized protein ACLA_054980 [Aspergillus clavatus NRRL 1]|uniref:Uncharacterized protein n=1 Tax=Aspergillus clavatus (strain ATCC 1007 / CBS 513.65 / DSM 816 / NCTC 3887 / NRRL 1 / QM 1276 / 107) TaxID=344612 RepID=A1C9C7_ASPCL|nr:uncharacterized protein ACLA_054980 [Aspergillus clavatus NRRL 1]EAW13451.1 hypothetical protein ACLA_054980 [Aspergillus clavatus NRRL 1]